MSLESRYQLHGTVFGHWQILNVLNREERSAMFQLVHLGPKQDTCALKVINLTEAPRSAEPWTSDRSAEYEARKKACIEAVERELLLLNDLRSKTNAVGFLEYAFWDWQDASCFGCDLLIRTELLPNLRGILSGGHRFTEPEILKLGTDLATALEFCHSNGILHGNIAPESVYLDRDGTYRLGDFGMSRAFSIHAAQAANTAYRAPEQFYGQQDQRSDIYSLGLLLYELANGGRLPMGGAPLSQLLHTGPALTNSILRACAPNPQERYQRAEEFSRELHDLARVSGRHAAHHNGNTPQTHTARKQEKSGSSVLLVVRTVVITVAVILALAVVGFAFVFFSDRGFGGPAAGTTGQTAPDTGAATQQTNPTAAQADPTASTEITVQTQATEEQAKTLPQSHPYYSCYDPDTEFVLPDSGSAYYAPKDLAKLTDKQLEVAFAEITARHGQAPQEKDLADYFSYMSWYAPGSGEAELSACEQANRVLLSVTLRKRAGTLTSSSNRFMTFYTPGMETFGDCSSRYLTGSDLKDLTHEEMILIRNEIFARRGYIFRQEELQEIFYCMDWYVPTYDDTTFSFDMFSDYDETNLELINMYEEILSYQGPKKDNPYIPYMTSGQYIFPDSGRRVLTEAELAGLSEEVLILAESEIYARHGLTFEEDHLMHYFLECYWYFADVAPGETQLLDLNATEKQNAALIANYRKNH